MACGDDWQCATGRCSVPADATCGVCAEKASAGAPCNRDDDCEYGLACDKDQCIARGAAGASCDQDHPCVSPNACNVQIGSTVGTCGPSVAAGGDCSNAACAIEQGLFCNPTNHLCQAAKAAQPGETCGEVNGDIVVCAGAFLGCNKGKPADKMGTCPALAAPGGVCSDTAPCKAGAKCIHGICTVADPASCR